MTDKQAFTEEEWETVSEGPTSAGFMVAMAQRGGTFKESFSIAKAYTEARKQHGASELLDALTSSKPAVDKDHGRSPEEVKTHALANISEALGVLEGKATPEEVEQYKLFVLGIAQRVAAAAKDVSPEEQAAIDEIASTLRLNPPMPEVD